MDDPTTPAEPAEDATTTVTIKAMRLDTWEKARAAAKKQGQPMGEWVARAVIQLADREAGERISFPDEAPEPRPGLPAVYPAGRLAPSVDMGALEQMMRTAQAISVASGVAVPKVAARHAFALVTATLREARGLPAQQPRAAGRLALPQTALGATQG